MSEDNVHLKNKYMIQKQNLSLILSQREKLFGIWPPKIVFMCLLSKEVTLWKETIRDTFDRLYTFYRSILPVTSKIINYKERNFSYILSNFFLTKYLILEDEVLQ